MPLTLGDLSEVYEKVYSVHLKWYNFGLALNLQSATLDAIRIKYREDPRDCLREMIIARLKLENPLMWRGIIRALRKPTVGESKLADQLEGMYDIQEPSRLEGSWTVIRSMYYNTYLIIHTCMRITGRFKGQCMANLSATG